MFGVIIAGGVYRFDVFGVVAGCWSVWVYVIL